jgi:transaldolase
MPVKVFVDSANLVELEESLKRGFPKGITTNPAILAKEPKGDFVQHMRRIIELIRRYGYDIPLSVEVFSTKLDEMLRQAEDFTRQFGDYANLYIKVPIGWDELELIAKLRKEGIKVNCTCCMSTNQAIMAAQAGANFVSLFYNRIRDLGYDPRPIIKDSCDIIDRRQHASEVIVGSIRHLEDINQAFLAGAHIVTIPPKFFKPLCSHPKTDESVAEFCREFKNWLA